MRCLCTSNRPPNDQACCIPFPQSPHIRDDIWLQATSLTNKGLKHCGSYCLISKKSKLSLVSPTMLPILLHPQKVGFCPEVPYVQGGCHSIQRKIHAQPHSKTRGNARKLRARLLCLYQERKFPEALWKTMRFRTRCSKMGHLGLPNILRWSTLRKSKKQESPPGFSSLFPLKQVIMPCDKRPHYTRRKATFWSSKRCQRNPSKQAFLSSP